MKRLVTALALIPTITYVVIWSPIVVFGAVLAAVASLCYLEYSGIVAAHGIEKPGLMGLLTGLGLLFFPGDTAAFVAIAVLLSMALALRSSDLRRELPRSAAFALGLLYVFGAWRCCVPLRAISPYWLFFAIALNWVGDSAAMYAGKTFGRNKLAPVISPGKTWEGAVASVIGSVIFGLIYAHYLLPNAPLWLVGAVAVVANIAGQIGDLCESAFKRGAGMKDSGTLLPGHGGWLDRVDSTLFAVPAAYALLAGARALWGVV